MKQAGSPSNGRLARSQAQRAALEKAQRVGAKVRRGRSHRAWGNIKKQRTKTASYQASFIGPDQRRHYAPTVFSAKMNAERWLARERDYKERCLATGEQWNTPKVRAHEKQDRGVLLGQYGRKVIDQRNIAPTTRMEYEAKWRLIEPALGHIALQDLTPDVVGDWFSNLGKDKPARNAHAYGLLSMICGTAVRQELIQRNPCQVVGALSVKPAKRKKVLTIPEVHGIADKLGADENTARFRALVLLAGYCGLRFGEVSELRRKDIRTDGTVLTVSRAVTHKGQCRIDTTKTGEDQRVVVIPGNIVADVKAHLANHVGKDADSLLFVPAMGGCHLNNRVFNKHIFGKAAASVGRPDVSAHDLRHFAGTHAQVAGATLAETMDRLGHKTVDAAMRYQHTVSDRDAAVAAALSAYALAELEAAARTNDVDDDPASPA